MKVGEGWIEEAELRWMKEGEGTSGGEESMDGG